MVDCGEWVVIFHSVAIDTTLPVTVLLETADPGLLTRTAESRVFAIYVDCLKKRRILGRSSFPTPTSSSFHPKCMFN